MKKVQILMSTYNAPEKYLREQLDSLVRQTYPVEILIRDDGSSDHTEDILKEYRDQYENIIFYKGENYGVIGSFFDLIQHADVEADYIALCDQDDVWKPEKISRAVKKIEEAEKNTVTLESSEQPKNRENENPAGISKNVLPVLYCSKTMLVDKNLQPIKSNIHRKPMRPGFGNALIENICTGCTAVMNKALVRMIISGIPKYTIMHDWWIYLVASCFGTVIYDEEPFILYRQHDENIMGIESDIAKETKNRAKKFKSRKNNISLQAAEFEKIFREQMTGEKGKLVKWVAGYHGRLKYHFNLAFRKGVYRQRKMDHFIFKILFLFGMR